MRHKLAAAAALALLPAAVAIASEPSSGTISTASPKATWTGTVQESVTAFHAQHTGGSDDAPCVQPTCDTYALKVADAAPELVLTADAGDNDAANVGLRVKMPDGSYVRAAGASSSPKSPLKLKIKPAPAGDYVVDYTNYYVGGEIPYTATATLTVPGAAPAATAAPAPGGGPAPTPAPPAQSFTLTVKAPKVSAKKAKKGRTVAVGVTVSREVSSVLAVLRKGKKEVGRGSLGKVAKSGKVKLLLGKALKKGAYSLYVEAKDAAGTTVSRTVKVTVKK
jgi:hypothetical protein